MPSSSRRTTTRSTANGSSAMLRSSSTPAGRSEASRAGRAPSTACESRPSVAGHLRDFGREVVAARGLFDAFAAFEAHETRDRDVGAELLGERRADLFHRLVGFENALLLEQAHFLEPLRDLALDDARPLVL